MAENPFEDIKAQLDTIERAITINQDWPMDRKQAAKYLGVPARTIDDLRRSGKISFHALIGGDVKDRHIRYYRSDLDKYLRSQRRQSVG